MGRLKQILWAFFFTPANEMNVVRIKSIYSCRNITQTVAIAETLDIVKKFSKKLQINKPFTQLCKEMHSKQASARGVHPIHDWSWSSTKI